MVDSPFLQLLSRSSLVYLLVWNPQIWTSLPNKAVTEGRLHRKSLTFSNTTLFALSLFQVLNRALFVQKKLWLRVRVSCRSCISASTFKEEACHGFAMFWMPIVVHRRIYWCTNQTTQICIHSQINTTVEQLKTRQQMWPQFTRQQMWPQFRHRWQQNNLEHRSPL